MNFPFFLARRFVAGENLADALRAARSFHAKGILVTLDHLGEDVTERRKAKRATATHMDIIDALARERIGANISIKLSQLGLTLDKGLAYKNAEQIMKRAKRHHLVVEIDMEGSRYTQDTLDIFMKLHKKYRHTLVAIQAYLYRSSDDAKNLLKHHGCIRLVKGGYKEPEAIAFKRKEDTDKNYAQLMKMFLLKGKFIAVATHDEKLIDEAKSFVKRRRISKKRFEFEMLYGIRRDLQEGLAREGYWVRVYVPYGMEWLPYFYRRMRERKENVLFVLRHVFRR